MTGVRSMTLPDTVKAEFTYWTLNRPILGHSSNVKSCSACGQSRAGLVSVWRRFRWRTRFIMVFRQKSSRLSFVKEIGLLLQAGFR